MKMLPAAMVHRFGAPLPAHFAFPAAPGISGGMKFSPTVQNSAAAAFALACAPWLWWLELRLLPKLWALQSACAGQLVSLSSAFYPLGTQLQEVTQLRDPAVPCVLRVGALTRRGAAALRCDLPPCVCQKRQAVMV